ncbi:MAG: hypothetical protein R3C03_21565 [Pirellulaceae bacterium]
MQKRRVFQFSIASSMVFTAIASATLAFGPTIRAYVATQGLSNTDVYVNGNPFGLFVLLESDSADTLRQLGAASNQSLQAALKDPNRFAAAHRLLLEINPEKFQLASPYWAYDMDPFGSASNDFDEELIPVLENFWKKALAEPQGFSDDDRRLEFRYVEPATYEIGDLVPCEADSADFELTICAWCDNKCVYQYGHSFCRHKGESTDPLQQPGLLPMHTACAMLVNGSMSGTLQYSKFAKNAVTVKIEWTVSLDGVEDYFRREFDVVLGDDGFVDAGQGNRIQWSFSTWPK